MSLRICLKVLPLVAYLFHGTVGSQGDPYHHYHKWWKSHRHGYGNSYGHSIQPIDREFWYAEMTPYRLFGKPPLRAQRPHGCKAAQLYMVFRHGERNPALVNFGYENLAPLEEVLNPLMKQSTGVSPTVDVKFPWKMRINKKDAGFQVPEGDKQIYNIGRRFARRFPELLTGRFSIADFNFTSSCSPRASQSTTAFGMGYLQGKGPLTKYKLQPIPLTTVSNCSNDRIHRPVNACPRFMRDIWNQEIAYAESRKFLKTEMFQKIIRKVRKKLGLEGVKEVDEEIVLAMFRACGWGVSIYGDAEGSRWCSLFSTEDQKIWNLYEDMWAANFWGPGFQLNLDTSCVQLQDLITNMKRMAQDIKSTQRPKKVIARFGHGQTIRLPLGKLGVEGYTLEYPLTVDNYENLKNRKFRLGKAGPMSGNYAFVLYKCHYGEYKVQLYIHEKLVKLPGCRSKVYCSLREFLAYHEDTISKCASKFDQICSV